MKVRILYEDKTGGGLHDVIAKEVARRRADRNVPRLDISHDHCDGNTDVIRRLKAFTALRDKFTHVFHIIDVKGSWRLLDLKLPPPPQTFDVDEVRRYARQVRDAMRRLARECCADRWDLHAAGFHAHALVWERESLVLPVADKLDLGPPEPQPYLERNAAGWIEARYKAKSRRLAYAKQTDGRRLLGEIANRRELRDIVLASNPSLQEIIDDLVAL